MLRFDPPNHTRLRKLVSAAFTRRRVDRLEPRIERIADELLDRLERSASGEMVDLIPAYAPPLPMTVICELIGVPETDRDNFRSWTTVLGSGYFAEQRVFARAAAEQTDYVRELVERKRRHPSDDLLSVLATVTEDGDRLSRNELTSMVWILVVAGHETTVNLIASGVHALLTNPDQFALLRRRPELIDNAVEEFLRFESPAWKAGSRYRVWLPASRTCGWPYRPKTWSGGPTSSSTVSGRFP